MIALEDFISHYAVPKYRIRHQTVCNVQHHTTSDLPGGRFTSQFYMLTHGDHDWLPHFEVFSVILHYYITR